MKNITTPALVSILSVLIHIYTNLSKYLFLFIFFFYLGSVMFTTSRHSLVSLHQIPVIGDPCNPLFLYKGIHKYLANVRVKQTFLTIKIFTKAYTQELKTDKTLFIIITHLSTVCELLDLSSCNTRNDQTNCHNSKPGQYLIPHGCGKI